MSRTSFAPTASLLGCKDIFTCAERKTPLAGVCASGAGCALLFSETLEIELAAELHNARAISGSELAKPAVIGGSADVLELGMIPGVEGLEANLEAVAT